MNEREKLDSFNMLRRPSRGRALPDEGSLFINMFICNGILELIEGGKEGKTWILFYGHAIQFEGVALLVFFIYFCYLYLFFSLNHNKLCGTSFRNSMVNLGKVHFRN